MTAESTASGELVILTPNDREAHEACYELHVQTLPQSVPVRFGRHFTTGFYLPRLLACGLLAGDVFRYDGRYVGYNLYTCFPRTFLRDGIRQHFGFLVRFMPGVFLRHPRALLALPDMFRNSGGFPPADRPSTGYWLTFGVLPEYRRVEVEGKNIATHLVDRMVEYFRKEGLRAVEGTVERNNSSAIFFYRRYGFAFEDRGLEGGAKLQVRYELT